MKPFINWEELVKLARLPEPQNLPMEGNMWDRASRMYNQMASMEGQGTQNQLNCFETYKTDTVLDIGCGTGRITVPMAKRAKAVTSIDSAERMLNFCIDNSKKAELTNVFPILVDWNDIEEPNEIVGKHDIVLR